MTTTATGEEPIEYGYGSNHWLASVLVNHAPVDHLATALKALLAQCKIADDSGDLYLSIKVVRESIVQILATGFPTVHTGINRDEDSRTPLTFAPEVKPKTYDAAKVDAMLDEYNAKKAFEELRIAGPDIAAAIQALSEFKMDDWKPLNNDNEEEN